MLAQSVIFLCRFLFMLTIGWIFHSSSGFWLAVVLCAGSSEADWECGEQRDVPTTHHLQRLESSEVIHTHTLRSILFSNNLHLFSFHIFSSPFRCHFSTFKKCDEWLKRLNRAIAHPARLEDLFALAYHAWCLGGNTDDEDQHLHMCRPGAVSPHPPHALYCLCTCRDDDHDHEML